ncbi:MULTISPECIES: helix-turn-helix domain-containing protein [unclassified Cellulomonas]|uniref:helix-turn-helix domain-containing protein n=1 Tax=unclassified Cellulomonas TaxID=2620175 RepID=UPI0019ACA3DE|nr:MULTISPECIES: helix-turn-helix domain-containing protein [unclassified Cellulomonas]MBD3779861.1 helix-turn-helix domain-containing protein [Micrococcales bacterium]QZN85963.1 helix-turn-helix domain-containing protein [Cellulomonas sp. C5510]WHP19210.1 helix-turn-helix domain-containing protein [Cellulomonas sp. ES6]
MTSEQPGRVRFLTVAEVAEVMRVSKMTVYRLLHSGEMPAVRVGRSFRVPQDALDHYLATARLDQDVDGDAGEGPRAGRLSS